MPKSMWDREAIVPTLNYGTERRAESMQLPVMIESRRWVFDPDMHNVSNAYLDAMHLVMEVLTCLY